MSTQSIVRQRKLNKMVKRVLLRMKLYVFKQRLQYKCNQRCIGYKEIDEAYTSKTCTICGKINKELGTSKIFNCKKCKKILDRDVNGARNIMLKSF